MKKIFAILFIVLFLTTGKTFAETEGEHFLRKYEEAQPADFELVQDLDPYQVEDYAKYAWAPYPLLRTSVTLHFKKITIEPGYYILTPRTIKDKDYVFFKQNGKVVYIVPVAEKEAVNPLFYSENTPVPKRNVFGKIYYKTRTGFYKIFKHSKKQEPPKAFIEVSTVDNVYIKIDLSYGLTRYSLYFKSVKDQ